MVPVTALMASAPKKGTRRVITPTVIPVVAVVSASTPEVAVILVDESEVALVPTSAPEVAVVTTSVPEVCRKCVCCGRQEFTYAFQCVFQKYYGNIDFELAIAMGTHARLGPESVLKGLSSDVLRTLLDFTHLRPYFEKEVTSARPNPDFQCYFKRDEKFIRVVSSKLVETHANSPEHPFQFGKDSDDDTSKESSENSDDRQFIDDEGAEPIDDYDPLGYWATNEADAQEFAKVVGRARDAARAREPV